MTKASDSVLVEREGGVALVTLNRPQAINAFDETVRTTFPAILADLENDAAIFAIVVRGAGDRGFCAGADIKETRAASSPVEERARLMPMTWIEAVDRVTKPVIAAIHGVCMGGGLELALACDIRVASEDASFALPETRLGLIPGGGGTQRLPRLIGLARALDLLLTAEPIDGREAYRIGLVSRLARDADATRAEAMRVARLIGERPPLAAAYCKEAAVAGVDMDLKSGLRLEKSLFALLTGTQDRKEAAAAFGEKRVPRFSGR